MYVYIYKHIFIATAPFPMGQQCQYLAHGSWPCQRKKRKIIIIKKKNNILVRIFIFFSLKLAFDMMIFYCRLGEGRDKGSSFEFIFKFSPFFLVYNFFFSCLKRVHTFVICVCCSSSKGSFSGSESVVSEYR